MDKNAPFGVDLLLPQVPDFLHKTPCFFGVCFNLDPPFGCQISAPKEDSGK